MSKSATQEPEDRVNAIDPEKYHRLHNPRKTNDELQVHSCCGKDNHNWEKCRFKRYICRNCSKSGYLARMCKGDSVDVDKNSKGKFIPSNKEGKDDTYNYVEYASNKNSGNSDNDLFNLFNCGVEDTVVSEFFHKTDNKPMLKSLVGENFTFEFELNTGAAISAISEKTYRKVGKFPAKPLRTTSE